MSSMSKRAIRVTTIKKRDAKRALLRLGFREEGGGDHTKYIHDNPFAIVIIGRGNNIDFLRGRESDNLRKALTALGREDIYRSMIGLPAKKKERVEPTRVPFFSAWANEVAKSLKALSFDRSITNVDEALYNMFVDRATKDDPTLSAESFKEDLKRLTDLISNDENHYISSLSAADILLAIRMTDPYSEGGASTDSILDILGEEPGLAGDVEQHVEMLRDKGFVESGEEIILSEKGLESSASSVYFYKLLKLSRWMRSSGLNKEAASILRLAHSDGWIPDVFSQEFRSWLRRTMLRAGDSRLDARRSVKNQMITLSILLRDNPHAIRGYYMAWKKDKDREAREAKLSLDAAREEYLKMMREEQDVGLSHNDSIEQLKLF